MFESISRPWAGATLLLLAAPSALATHGSGSGEIENRPAPVARRACLAGTNVGDLCDGDADCPGSTCRDRNVFNITVSVRFDATDAQLTTIETAIQGMSNVLFDATDGQAEIGQATIVDNATTGGDIVVFPTGPCNGGGNFCADSGHWKTGGTMDVGFTGLGVARAGEAMAHEFLHLVFDARDEYESRSGGCAGASLGGGSAQCPSAAAVAAGQEACLMDVGGLNNGPPGTELCWGQGSDALPLSFAAGNHDPGNSTEQSQCRSNRSCWAQMEWSWPQTIQPPAGAPTAAAGAPNAATFVRLDVTARLVLVLDRSGSMGTETPTRLERLQVAAKDLIALAPAGTEIGIVSYSGSATDDEAIDGVDASHRADLEAAVDSLTDAGATYIGDGLKHARDMISSAGGVTGSTSVILMTDGINNRPVGGAAENLQGWLDTLLTDGIPVQVICTGGDLGLSSQCSEIAVGTNGTFTDSTDASRLPEAFVDALQNVVGGQPSAVLRSSLEGITKYELFVERGAEELTVTAQWDRRKTEAQLILTSPRGEEYAQPLRLERGQFIRLAKPEPGTWLARIESRGGATTRFVSKAFVKNPAVQVRLTPRHATVAPGEPIYVYAMPVVGGPVTTDGEPLVAIVERPDGKLLRLRMSDRGPGGNGHEDEFAEDGVFTGVLEDTKLKGRYRFTVDVALDGSHRAGHGHDGKEGDHRAMPRFARQAQASVAVAEPGDSKERSDPLDGKDRPEQDVPPETVPRRCRCDQSAPAGGLWLLAGLLGAVVRRRRAA